jgi:hypothetical protein
MLLLGMDWAVELLATSRRDSVNDEDIDEMRNAHEPGEDRHLDGLEASDGSVGIDCN